MSPSVEDCVVLLDECGLAAGTADRRTVHNDRTSLQLAFSRYVFGRSGHLLMTRRARGKTFGGMWTDSFCGHPRSGETLDAAEVDAVGWVEWDTFSTEADSGARTVSPWCRERIRRLRALGPRTAWWPASPDRLPPAARRSPRLFPSQSDPRQPVSRTPQDPFA